MKIAESTVSPQYSLTIPSAVRTALALKQGDVLEWIVEDSILKVQKKQEEQTHE